jgi:hypothetical protein
MLPPNWASANCHGNRCKHAEPVPWLQHFAWQTVEIGETMTSVIPAVGNQPRHAWGGLVSHCGLDCYPCLYRLYITWQVEALESAV